MKTKALNKKAIGKLGEDIACMFLMKHGYSVVSRNYLRKWGEIDIVAFKDGITYFVEVKSVTYQNVKHETQAGEHRPEDNINPWKLKKLARIVDTYLKDKDIYDTEWKFLALTVRLNMKTRRAKVSVIDGVVL